MLYLVVPLLRRFTHEKLQDPFAGQSSTFILPGIGNCDAAVASHFVVPGEELRLRKRDTFSTPYRVGPVITASVQTLSPTATNADLVRSSYCIPDDGGDPILMKVVRYLRQFFYVDLSRWSFILDIHVG